jgi:small subunit ribosomal protein S2
MSDEITNDIPEIIDGRATEVPHTAALAGERAQAALSGELDKQLRDPGTPLSVRELFEAGAHFGHQTKRWNPKMKQYIYGARSGVHILDLDQTASLFKKAFDFLSDAVARGGSVLFVGTKRQAAEIIREEAARSEQFYVTNRWLGGTLTNYRTMKSGLDRLKTLERMAEDGTYQQLVKKETVRLDKERARLEKYIGGMKGMAQIPAAIFIVDPSQEQIAINEARKLHVPVVAITDTNCNPDLVDFVIPANDDAIRSIRLITSAVADACVYGMARRREHQRDSGGELQSSKGGNEAKVMFARR